MTTLHMYLQFCKTFVIWLWLLLFFCNFFFWLKHIVKLVLNFTWSKTWCLLQVFMPIFCIHFNTFIFLFLSNVRWKNNNRRLRETYQFCFLALTVRLLVSAYQKVTIGGTRLHLGVAKGVTKWRPHNYLCVLKTAE